MDTHIIVNPRAGGGSGSTMLARLDRALRAARIPHRIETTAARGQATQLAREARKQGARLLVAVGGDGTFNEVSQALLNDLGQPAGGPELLLIASGTGGDLHRSLELSDNPDDAVRILLEPRVRQVDLGVIHYQDFTGRPETRAFLNECSFGLSARVARMANAGPKWLGPKMTYLGAALAGALTHQSPMVRIQTDDRVFYQGRARMVAFANGKYFGGGMQIAPDADPSDGLLDCVVLGNLTKLQTYALTSHIYAGTHISRDKVEVRRGTRFEVTPIIPHSRIEIEIDGETPGQLPIQVEIIPAAVRLRY